MSTPKENPITIRRAGLRELIQAHADKQGIIFNRAAVDLILKGLGVSPAKRILKLKRPAKTKPRAKATGPRKAKTPKDVLAEAEKAVGVAAVALGQTAPAAPKTLDTSAVPFNPTRAPMQKPPKGKTRWG